MSPTSQLTPAALLDEIVTALRRGDVSRADRALAAAERPPAAEAMLRLAELNMRRRRWSDAAWLFDHASPRDAAADLRRRLAHNLAALHTHLPAVHDALANLPAQEDVKVTFATDGRPTLACRRADGGFIGLSPGNDPTTASASMLAQVRAYLDRGQAIALCGVGDGYLLDALRATKPPCSSACGSRSSYSSRTRRSPCMR